jgi:hypothetical protein
MEIGEPILALVAAIFGGAGLKLIESILSRTASRSALAKEIRDELRVEVLRLRDELNEVSERLKKQKEEYFRLLFAFNAIASLAMSNGLQDEVRDIVELIED